MLPRAVHYPCKIAGGNAIPPALFVSAGMVSGTGCAFAGRIFPRLLSQKGFLRRAARKLFSLPFLLVSATSRMNMHSMHIYASLFSQVLWLLRFHAQHLGIKVINSPIGLCKASDRLYPLIFRCFRAMIGAFGNHSVPSSGLSTA